MKISKLLFAALAMTLILLPATSQAELKSGAVTLSPLLGGIVTEGDQHLDEGIAFGLGLGYNITKAFGLEAVLVGANLKEDGTENDADLKNYRLDALYHFMPDRALVPYAALGVGGYDIEKDSEYMANYGLGLLYLVSENVALRADVRHLAVFNESRLEHNLLYTAGLKFQFGGPAGPAPTDSDGDGVFDNVDQCPATPKGIIVDAKGCPLKLTLHINFDSDKAEIKPEFKGELDKAAAFVRGNPDAPYILLAGHTDSVGDDNYNQGLSERRAEAVRQALIENYGIAASKLKARGYGESQPVADNATEDGRYQNRRVEVVCCAVLPD